MNNGQILDEVKHLRDDNSSKNTIIKLLTGNISDITKSFSNKQNQEKPFISPKNMLIINLPMALGNLPIAAIIYHWFLLAMTYGLEDLEL